MNWAVVLFGAVCVLLLINIVMERLRMRRVGEAIRELVRLNTNAREVVEKIDAITKMVGVRKHPLQERWELWRDKSEYTLKTLQQQGHRIPPPWEEC